MLKFIKRLANRLKGLKGEWVMDEDGFPYCNKCGLYPDFTTDFCPHCGADMRTEGDAEE